MRDQAKTKDQLIDELAEFRHKVGELKESKDKLKKMKEDSQEREQRLSFIYNSVTDVLYHLRVEPEDCFRFLSINQPFLDVTGLKKKQVVNKRIEDVIPEPSVWMVLSNYKKAIEENRIVKWEETSIYPTGKKIGEVSISPILNKKGVCTHLIGSVHDITERKQTEDALKRTSTEWEITFNSAQDLIMLLDKEFNIVKANLAVSKFLQLDLNKIIGMKCYQLFHKTEAPPDLCPLEKMKRTKKAEEVEMYLSEKGIWISSSVNPVLDDNGNLEGGVHIIKNITECKQAEEALKGSEKRFRELAELLPEMVVETDTKGNITFVNNAVLDSFGYSRADFEKGMNTIQLLIREEKERHKKYFVERIGGRDIGTNEYIAQRKDGNNFPVIVHSNVITDDERNVVGTRAIVMDITERKKAEDALQESEEQYRAVFEQAADSIVLIDAKTGELVEFNDKAHESLGYTRDEFEKLKIPDFEVFESTEEVTKHIEKIIKEGFDTFETKHRTKGGEIQDILVNSKAISIGGKDFVQSVWMDITERKKAEETLRESEEKYRQLFENSSDAVMIFDEQTRRFEDANKATLDLYGYTREEFLKLQVIDLSAEPERTKTAVDKISNGKTGSIVVPIRKHKKRDGTVFMTEISAGAFYSKGRKKIIGEVRDITDRIKAEEEREKLQAQLIQSEKMAGIGTLTSGIAHEFNNLLQIMSGHAEFAQRTKKPEDMEEALEIVENTSDRVSKIIKDLLTFSRRDALGREPRSIPELIDFVLSMTEEQLNKNNIKVVREYGGVPKIDVNMGEIQQVFLNLVTNARDSMLPRGGKLEIRIKKVKDHVEISFTDTGIGIKEENISRVFEPFYTTKGAVGGDTRTQGIGLGLSVSYGIVQRHRGTIEVESDLERGTIFTIRLPAKVEKAKERVVKEKSKPKAKKTKPRSVLVVDDEEEICKMFTKWLSAEGHKVKSATTGKKALDLVKKESFDIMFLDIVMPGIPASDTLAEIKELSPKTKIFMITGKLVDKELWKGLKAEGASGYLQKPFKIENIKNCIAKIRD